MSTTKDKTGETKPKAGDGTASALNEDGSISQPPRVNDNVVTAKTQNGVEVVIAPNNTPGWEPAGKEPTEQEKASYKRWQDRQKQKDGK